MNRTNKQGLSQTIPTDVKREVRRKAGFGCVVCGKAFGQYHHFDPKFEDASNHNPDCIVFVCPNHHEAADEGRLSKQSILYHAQYPLALQKGFSFGVFDMRCEKPILSVGEVTAINCRNFFRIDGRPILWINPPEISGGPFQLNADITDSKGEPILKIVDNEWQSFCGKFDIVTKGRRIIIYEKLRKIDLIIRVSPPENFFIERLNMDTNGYKLACDGKNLTVTSPSKRTVLNAMSLSIEGAVSVIDIEGDEISVGSLR